MGAYESRIKLRLRAAWLSSTALILAVVMLAALAPPAFVCWHAWNARDAAIERAFRAADDLVLSLSQHAARSFAEPGFVIRDAIEHIQVDGVGPDSIQRLHAILVNHAKDSRVIREIGVLDEQGYWRTSSLPQRPTHSNGDREYFVFHRNNPDDKAIRVSRPIVSRLTGKWTILVTQRIDHADGRFAGIALASISVEYFQNFYNTLNIGEFGQIELYRADAHLLVRRPFVEENLLMDRTQPLFAMTSNHPSGRYHGASMYDGTVTLAAWQTLDDFPLIMLVSRSESDVLSDWRRSTIVDMTVAVAASLVIALLGSLSVITVRRRIAAETSAAEAGRRYAMIAETASDIIVHVAADGRRLYISPACREMLGYEPEELIGQDFQAIAHPDDIVVLEEALDRLRAGERRATAVYRVRHRDGHYLWVEVNFRAVNSANLGTATEMMASTRDISARMLTERQLAEAKEAAEAANRAKSNFLSGMSHELRTPLNAIIGFSELMAKELFGPLGNRKYVSYAQDIHVSGEHLLALINDVLDQAKIDSGQFELHEAEVGVDDTLRFAAQMMTLQAEQAGLSLHIESRSGARLFADERRIRQILINLLSNAIKYTPQGGQIGVSADLTAGGDLQLTVSDTGIGMSDDDKLRALQPFAQVDNQMNRSKQGTGLGLTLTRRLAELHGGRLELHSALGEGTTVTIILPATRMLVPRTSEATEG